MDLDRVRKLTARQAYRLLLELDREFYIDEGFRQGVSREEMEKKFGDSSDAANPPAAKVSPRLLAAMEADIAAATRR